MANLVHIDSLIIGDTLVLENNPFKVIEKGFVSGNPLQPESRVNRYFKYLKAVDNTNKVYYREHATANTFGSHELAQGQDKFMIEKLN